MLLYVVKRKQFRLYQRINCGELLMIAIMMFMIADIYISISTGTFDIENIKYEKKWQQLDLDTNFEP